MDGNSTIEIELNLILPSVGHDSDPCVGRLLTTAEHHDGVVRVSLSPDPKRSTVCVEFDSNRISGERVQVLLKTVGFELEEQYRHLSIQVHGITTDSHARSVSKHLLEIEGVQYAVVDVAGEVLYVELEVNVDDSRVRTALGELGVLGAQEPAPATSSTKEEHVHGGIFGGNSELIFSLLAGALTLGGWLLETLRPDFASVGVRGVFWGAYFFGGYYAVLEVIQAIRKKRFEIDFLMLVAAAGAGALGEWTEGALLLFLFSLGHALEGFAMNRARRAIESLSDLAPKTATVIRDDGTNEDSPVDQLKVRDRVLVRPNSRVPADGFVVDGISAVNQAPITGESIAVDKSPVDDIDVANEYPDRVSDGSRVFAGTINGASALEVIVTKAAADSTLARVVAMVRDAQTQQSPTQQFTERFERIFVPSVMALVALCLFAWVVIDEPFTASFYRSMAVLVAASPCALAIATPSAVLSGVARAARYGVLIKGGVHLETLGVATVIAFDKTGTLTRGEPRVTDVRVAQGADRGELARVTVAIERESDHPLARAIVEELSRDMADSAIDAAAVEAIAGYGVRAEIEGVEFYLGKPDLFRERLSRALPDDLTVVVEELENAGRSTVVVATDERFLGVLGLMDTPRDEAKTTIAKLRELGIVRMLMLSGDHQRAANGVAELVGLDEARGDLLPDDKVSAIRELAREGTVAMVGDGVNDAPAMAQASVGIAMGAGGSDVALETADVALMADDLAALPFAVSLSRASRRVIRQNLWASLGMVAFLIPSTLLGFTGIGWAVLLHEGSTLLVVVNALRLLAHPGPGSLTSEDVG